MANTDACFIGKYRLAFNLTGSHTKLFPDERGPVHCGTGPFGSSSFCNTYAGKGRHGQRRSFNYIFICIFCINNKKSFLFPVSAYPEVNNNREKVKQFLPPPTNAFLYLILSFRNSNEKAV